MNEPTLFDLFMYNIPLIAAALMFIIPFGMLANATYKAVYKVNKVPTATAILHYIPFYNYTMIRQYLYNSGLPVLIASILSVLCLVFRVVCLLACPTNLWMMAVSVYIILGGIVLWYLIMAFTAAYTAIMTRRSVFTIILSIVLPFFGAYIVSKNIGKFFEQELYKDSEFNPN